MEVLRTPDERFDALPGFAHTPRYVEVEGLRIHYIDAGPPGGAPVLLMHGEPSWSFLWRHVIDVLLQAGQRVVAIDLVGFGRSDKPARGEDHTYARHVGWVRGAVAQIGLEDVTLVGHDWGGLIGLRVVAEDPDRFARVVATNTGLPTGDHEMPRAFHRWRELSQTVEVFTPSAIIDGGSTTELAPEVLAAYDAPFPDDRYKAAPRRMPMLVPVSPDDPASAANRAAWERLREWTRPFLCAFSDSDPVTRGADELFKQQVPGCAGLEHPVIRGAGHFLQEDQGEALGTAVAAFIASTPG